MATYRIGIGSFNLKDGAVGIGTESTGLGNLKVEGTIKTTDLDVGVSTFTRYSGFEGEETKFDKDVTLSGEYSTTGDIVVDTGATLTVGLGSTACIGSVECLSVKHHFSVPVGDTAGRNKSSGYAEGTVRYNRDLGTMEFFNGNEWRQFNYITDIQNSPSSRSRAVIYQGYQPSYYPDMIDFLQITTLGNTQYFGDQNGSAARDRHGCGSDTRGVFGGGITPGGSRLGSIEYVTLQSQGNGIDFGDLTQGQGHGATCSSSTRGLFGNGYQPSLNNTVGYVQIQTLGDALDFGDLLIATGYGSAGSSPTRGIYCGGEDSNSLASDRTEFFTFGSNAGNSGQIVGIDQTNSISLGNSINFGDLAYDHAMGFAAGNNTRVVVGGGQGGGTSPAFQQNNIQYITIASSGNSVDFGEMTLPTVFCNATSDSHGGLGGY